MDDFLLRAALGGVGVALAAGPLGCIVVWRRMSYFGAALAHAALLGVALGFLLDINPTLGILILCLLLGITLIMLERQRLLASDTLLGILAHATLALGLVCVAFMERLRIDLMGYLFGDVLAVSSRDLYVIYGLTIASLVVLAVIWRSLLSATVNEEIAEVEGVSVSRTKTMFVLLLATVIAIGMKIVGVLLIVSLLIIPAAAARRLSATPEGMAIAAATIGVLSVLTGLASSFQWDVPTGPTMVVAATAFFAVSLVLPRRGPGTLGRAKQRKQAAIRR